MTSLCITNADALAEVLRYLNASQLLRYLATINSPHLMRQTLDACATLFDHATVRHTLIKLASLRFCIDVYAHKGTLVSLRSPVWSTFMKAFLSRVLVRQIKSSNGVIHDFDAEVLTVLNREVNEAAMDMLDDEDRLLHENGKDDDGHNEHIITYTYNLRSARYLQANQKQKKELVDLSTQHAYDQQYPTACSVTTLRMCEYGKEMGLVNTESRCAMNVYYLTRHNVVEKSLERGGYGGHWYSAHRELLDTVAGLKNVRFLVERYPWLLTFTERVNKFVVSILDTIDADLDDHRIADHDKFKLLCNERLQQLCAFDKPSKLTSS